MFLLSCVIFVKNFGLAQGTDLPAPLIRSAEAQAKSLESQLGAKVEVARELRQQPVLMVPQGAKPEDLLRGLAFALHASLVQDGQVTRIVRSKLDQDALRSQDRQVVRKALSERIAQWDREIQRTTSFRNTGAIVADLIHSDAVALSTPGPLPGVVNQLGVDPGLLCPAGLLLRGLVSKISLADLADIDSGEGKVFSNRPTDMETAISGTEQLVDEFAKDQEAFSKDSALSVSEQDKRNSGDGYLLPKHGISLDGLKCILTEGRDRSVVRLSLAVYNAKGEFVAGAWTFTAPRTNGLAYQRVAIAAGSHKDDDVTLDNEPLVFDNALQLSPTPIATTSPVWTHITHPESYDPANFLIPTALEPWLKSNQAPVIAVIPDDLTMAAHTSVRDHKLNTAAFESLLSDSCERVVNEGIQILRPNDPLCSDKYNCDRSSLGSALRRFLTLGQIDLRNYSLLCFEQGSAFSVIPKLFVNLVASSASLPRCDGNMYDDVFQMLGSVPSEKWDSLEDGASVEVNDDNLRSMLWKFIFRTPLGFAAMLKLPDIDDQAPELFPHGMSTMSRIVIRTKLDLVLRLPSSTQADGRGDMDIPTFVRLIHGAAGRGNSSAVRLGGSTSAIFGEMTKRATLAQCHRMVAEIQLELADGISLTYSLNSASRPIGPIGSFASLPSPYREAILGEWNRLEAADTLLPGHG